MAGKNFTGGILHPLWICKSPWATSQPLHDVHSLFISSLFWEPWTNSAVDSTLSSTYVLFLSNISIHWYILFFYYNTQGASLETLQLIQETSFVGCFVQMYFFVGLVCSECSFWGPWPMTAMWLSAIPYCTPWSCPQTACRWLGVTRTWLASPILWSPSVWSADWHSVMPASITFSATPQHFWLCLCSAFSTEIVIFI